MVNKKNNRQPVADAVLELESLQMELEGIQFEIDSLQDRERYLKGEIEKLEAKLEE